MRVVGGKIQCQTNDHCSCGYPIFFQPPPVAMYRTTRYANAGTAIAAYAKAAMKAVPNMTSSVLLCASMLMVYPIIPVPQSRDPSLYGLNLTLKHPWYGAMISIRRSANASTAAHRITATSTRRCHQRVLSPGVSGKQKIEASFIDASLRPVPDGPDGTTSPGRPPSPKGKARLPGPLRHSPTVKTASVPKGFPSSSVSQMLKVLMYSHGSRRSSVSCPRDKKDDCI